MIEPTLADLQVSVQDRLAFRNLTDYLTLCSSFLELLERTHPTRIVSPTHPNYIFYQYDETHSHRITRPLNTHLFIENEQSFLAAFNMCLGFLDELKTHLKILINQENALHWATLRAFNSAHHSACWF